MPSSDLYFILGVPPGATADEIRKAYLERARQLHPDSGEPGASHERFVELQAAYDRLSDRDARRRYDAERAAVRPADIERALRAEAMRRSGSLVEDLLYDEPWSTLGRIFTGLGLERLSKHDPDARARLSVEVTVTGAEAADGAAFTVRVPRVASCRYCSGTGDTGRERCRSCNGLGRVKAVQAVAVQAPPFTGSETTIDRTIDDLELRVRIRVRD